MVEPGGLTPDVANELWGEGGHAALVQSLYRFKESFKWLSGYLKRRATVEETCAKELRKLNEMTVKDLGGFPSILRAVSVITEEANTQAAAHQSAAQAMKILADEITGYKDSMALERKKSESAAAALNQQADARKTALEKVRQAYVKQAQSASKVLGSPNETTEVDKATTWLREYRKTAVNHAGAHEVYVSRLGEQLQVLTNVQMQAIRTFREFTDSLCNMRLQSVEQQRFAIDKLQEASSRIDDEQDLEAWIVSSRTGRNPPAGPRFEPLPGRLATALGGEHTQPAPDLGGGGGSGGGSPASAAGSNGTSRTSSPAPAAGRPANPSRMGTLRRPPGMSPSGGGPSSPNAATRGGFKPAPSVPRGRPTTGGGGSVRRGPPTPVGKPPLPRAKPPRNAKSGGGGSGDMLSDEERAAFLQELWTYGSNGVCADCSAAEPDWYSINLGVLICIDCSGTHRSLGTHITKVRSFRLDKMSTEIRDSLAAMGNDAANAAYEASLPPGDKIVQGSKRRERDAFITAKYVDKAYYSEPAGGFGGAGPASPRSGGGGPPKPKAKPRRPGGRPPAPRVLARVIAVDDYEGDPNSDLSFVRGDVIEVLKMDSGDSAWWTGRIEGTTASGLFPSTFVCEAE